MNVKKLLFPSLLICSVLALIYRLFAKPASAKPASKGASYDAIDAYIAGQMRRLKIPGGSLAIVEGDRIVHLRGFGKSRPGGEAPSPETPFFIGSLTKSFTALAVMQQVEAGKVELDAPVQRYLPWFRVAEPQASALMTVRHLLNQTSGLQMLPGMILLADLNNSPDATERQARDLSKLKLTRPVGAEWEYSNLNYNLLGLIVESASGELYADYVQNHIFNPLGMRHSYTTKAAAQQNGLAVGNRHWFSLPLPAPNMPVPRGSLPSGQLISSAEDMARYLIAHLNGGHYGDVQILSVSGVDELHRGVKKVVMLGISAGSYGMGWFDIDIGQTKTFSHGGNVPDFSAFMALIPSQEKGMVLLLNADPYGLPLVTEEIGMGATAVLAGQQPAPIKLDFIQWVMRLLPLLLLLQVVSAFTTLRMLKRWERKPALRPSRGRMWGEHILLPLIPNLSLAAIPVFLQARGMLRYLKFYNPDISWIALICGGFAGIWAFLRTGLILESLRNSPASNIPPEDTNL